MQEETWSMLIDKDATPEQFARELSPEFLAYVQGEAATLDTGRKAKIIIALLYLQNDQIEMWDEAITKFCVACEKDDEDWIRIVIDIVLRWLKRAPKDRVDAFSESEQRIIAKVKASEKHNDESDKAATKFSLPFDVVPTHWPFLAMEALPKDFDLAALDSNHHFKPRQRPKKLKVTHSRQDSVQSLPAANLPVAEKPREAFLPEKIRDLIAQGSSLLTSQNREVLLRFFSQPKSHGITEPTEIPIHELHTDSVERPGMVEIMTISIKLTPEPKYQISKKKRFAPAAKVARPV